MTVGPGASEARGKSAVLMLDKEAVDERPRESSEDVHSHNPCPLREF